MPSTAAYSAMPLAKKPGIKEGFVLGLINAPAGYGALLTDWPPTTQRGKKTSFIFSQSR